MIEAGKCSPIDDNPKRKVAANIEAVDRIDLSAKDDLTLLAGFSLGGINGEKAREISLRAGDSMIPGGAINADKLSVR